MRFNRNFYLLVIGQSIANLGDSFYIICVISSLYRITGSATASAFVPFTITISMFISSILSPIAMRKWALKSLLVSSQIGKTIILLFLSLFVILFMNEGNYFIIFILISLIALLDGCANPIMFSLLPFYVDQQYLVKANSIVASVSHTLQIASWFFGGLLLIWIGADTFILVVVGLFIISFVMFSGLTVVQKKEKTETVKISQSLMQGWKVIRKTPVLKVELYIDVLETVASTVWIAAIVYVYVDQALHVSEKWWGFINASYFIGLLVGSVYVMKNATIIDNHKFTFILVGSIVTAICTIIFGLTSLPMVALTMTGLLGAFDQLKNIPQETMIQKAVPPEELPTVYSSMSTVSLSLYGVMALLGGILVDWIGVRSVFLGSGVLLIIVTFIISKNKRLFI